MAGEGIAYERAPSDDKLMVVLAGIRDHRTAETLAKWMSELVMSLHDFSHVAVKAVQMSRAGRSIALMEVLRTLEQVYSSYQALISDHSQALARSVVAPFRSPSPPDAPQPGDVRTVFSTPQVFVDGCWWELGARCAP